MQRPRRRPSWRAPDPHTMKGLHVLTRDPMLQTFLTCVAEAADARSIGTPARETLDRIYGALVTPAPGARPVPRRLPVCEHLPDALSPARGASAVLARVADAFAALEPSLSWRPRAAGGPNASENWPGGHANTSIVGANGLEFRDDLQIGASLLAPHVRYPDHRHAPEEVYLVLTPGRFQHGGSGWFEPGIGGTLYNEPDIRHAMASDDAPLFALWFLWIGEHA